MKIIDKTVLRELNTVRCLELEEDIDSYPEDERDGRSDMEFFADEVSYFVSLYFEGGTCHSEDLDWAREVLRETENGKVMPLWSGTLQPKYRESDVENARSSVNEFRRLCNCLKRLQKRGFYGRWYNL